MKKLIIEMIYLELIFRFLVTDLSIGVEERAEINLPNHSEPEIVRHFTQLSRQIILLIQVCTFRFLYNEI